MDSKQALGLACVFALIGVIAYLGLQPSEQRTLIISNSSGSNVSSINDLDDVTLISLINGQILKYNSTSGQWENENLASFTDTTECNNIGSGTALICVEGTNINFRSILASTGLSAVNSSNTITLTNTLPESTTCANLGASSSLSEGIYVSGNCNFKKLLEGTGILLSSNSTHITLTNSAPDDTSCSNVGTGKNIYKDGECNFRSVLGSPDISVTQQTNTITIDFNGTDNNSCTNTGSGEPICESANNINSLITTSPLTVTDTTGDLTVACSTCWIQLDSSSPTDGATSWTSGTFTAKKYLRFEVYIKGDSTTVTAGNLAMQFNSDTGANYNYYVYVAGSRTASASQTSARICNIDENYPWYLQGVVLNPSGTFKKGGHFDMTDLDGVNLAGGQECETYISWSNTSNQITSVTLLRTSGTWAFDSTTNMVIYGHD